MNFLKGRIAGLSKSNVNVELGEVHMAVVRCKPDSKAVEGAAVTLGVRPEALRLDGQGDSTIAAKVHTVERLGGDTYLYLHTLEVPDGTLHAPGDMVVSLSYPVGIGFHAHKSD